MYNQELLKTIWTEGTETSFMVQGYRGYLIGDTVVVLFKRSPWADENEDEEEIFYIGIAQSHNLALDLVLDEVTKKSYAQGFLAGEGKYVSL